jgi:hypothetical protein
VEAAEPKAAPNCDDPNPETAGVLPDKPLVPRPIEGVRTNLGTRNHEFRRLPDSYGYNGKNCQYEINVLKGFLCISLTDIAWAYKKLGIILENKVCTSNLKSIIKVVPLIL